MCVCAPCSVRSALPLLQSLSPPAPHPNCVSPPHTHTHSPPFHSLTPSPPKSSEWPPSSSTGGTIDDSSPVSLPPTSLANTADTPVLKVCHNNGPEEELFWAQPLLTQTHTDPRQTYIVMVTIRNVCQLGSFVMCA